MRTDEMIMMRRLAMVFVLAVVLAGCGGDGNETAGVESVETTVTLAPRTPEPSADQAAEIESRVAAIYPGVPEGKAADWARSTCSDMLRGDLDRAQLAERAIMRYSGGVRPDPTPDQAEQILVVIESGGWCR